MGWTLHHVAVANFEISGIHDSSPGVPESLAATDSTVLDGIMTGTATYGPLP